MCKVYYEGFNVSGKVYPALDTDGVFVLDDKHSLSVGELDCYELSITTVINGNRYTNVCFRHACISVVLAVYVSYVAEKIG